MEQLETSTQGELDEESIVNVDFRRYLAAVRRYAWMIAALFVLAIAGAVIYTVRVTPIYEAVASVQIEPRLPDLLGTGDMFNVAAAGNNTAEYYKQQRQVLGSYKLCQQTVVDYDLGKKLLGADEYAALSSQDRIEAATKKLVSMISIKYPEQDRIMYVHVRSSDAELATAIANDHVHTYENYAKGLLSINSTQASDALQAEFNDAEAKLRAAEDKIYKFQAENDMIAVTVQEHQNMVSSNILNFTQKLNDARASEIAIAAKLAQMKKESGKDALSTPIVVIANSTSFDTVRAQYYLEKSKLLEMAKDLGAKHPDYIAQQQKVDELYKALEREVNALLAGTEDLHSAASATTRALQQEVERYKDEARKLSPKIMQYNEYVREKKLLEDQYNILRARLSATQLTGNMSSAISNVHPLDPALEPTKPVWPRMPINVAVAAVGALFVSALLVFLLVFLDRSIKTPNDATQAAHAPVLGFIPALAIKGDARTRDMFVHEHPTSHVAECCRALRTNVMFSAASGDGPEGQDAIKTLVICSANAQEGKTTTAMYLGTTMAQSGQKVLLIDTDMRRPRLHVSTGVSREPGLSSLLLGDDNYDEVIRATAVPNLFVLPCGPLPPNPVELLMTKRFETIMAELEHRFTKIILDSPPLQPVTDGLVLARRSAGVILVVRSGRTIRDELKRCARMIRGVNGRVFGLVLNDREERDRSYYYSMYGGYGRAEADEETPAA